jgi:AcrR family transcriptional regulator
MTRIVKKPDERKTEIMDSAEYFFNSKGFETTTVDEILQRIGVAKGTFYYYFKSKLEVLDAIIERQIDIGITAIKQIVEQSDLKAIEKFRMIVTTVVHNNDKESAVTDFLHKQENIVMHHKTLVQSIKKAAPLFTEVFRQGVEEKTFVTNYPQELSEILLITMNLLFDSSVFSWNSNQHESRLRAMQDIFETSLRVPGGTFSFIYEGFKDLPEQHLPHGRI